MKDDIKTTEKVTHDLAILHQEIAELKKAEAKYKQTVEALQKSEEYFRAITQNSSDIIIIVDKKGTITYVNPSIERLLGYKPEELIGKSGFDFIMLADIPRAIYDFGRAILTNNIIIPNAFRVRHKDGSEHVLEGVGNNLLDNPVVAGFVMNVRDITDRTKAEEELSIYRKHLEDLVEERTSELVTELAERKRAEEALRTAEELYKTLATGSQAAIYIVQSGKIRFVNPRFSLYSGHAENSLMGMNILSFVHIADRGMVREKAIRMLKGELKMPYEFRVIDAYGQTRWFVEAVSPITYEGKRATLGSAMDITERKKMEKQLEETRYMLVQSDKLAVVGRLSTGVAHEILNPINIISVVLQLLQKMKTLSPEVKEELNICREQVNRVVAIIENLKQISRIPAKKMTMNDIGKVIDHILKFCSSQLKVENIETDIEHEADLPAIFMDREKIEQVILNLIMNAIYALEKKEKKILQIVTRKIASDEDREWLRITVADNGCGIRKEDMPNLFDPFFTTKEPGKGTGLGLFISYGIIHDHGGRIWAENNDRGGASFFIELPVKPGADENPSKDGGDI